MIAFLHLYKKELTMSLSKCCNDLFTMLSTPNLVLSKMSLLILLTT